MSKGDKYLSHTGITYRNKKEANEILLSSLLQCYGNDERLIRGFYKKIKGYGLKQTEFDDVPLFRNNKEKLLKNYFIRKIKTKNGKYFSLTPYGLIQYCNSKESFEDYEIISLLRFLEFHFNQFKSKQDSKLLKSLNRIIKNTDDLDLRYKFHDVISAIKTRGEGFHLTVDCLYKLYHGSVDPGLDVLVTSISYFEPDNEYFLKFDINSKKTTRKPETIKEENFNHIFAKFIIEAFLHSLYTFHLKFIYVFTPRPNRRIGILSIDKMTKDKKEHQKNIKSNKSFDKIALDIVKKFNNELKSNIELHSTQLDIIG